MRIKHEVVEGYAVYIQQMEDSRVLHDRVGKPVSKCLACIRNVLPTKPIKSTIIDTPKVRAVVPAIILQPYSSVSFDRCRKVPQ